MTSPARAVVAAVEPEVRQPRELLADRRPVLSLIIGQQQLYPVPIGDIRLVYRRPQHKALRVDEHVALAPVDFFPPS